MRQEEKIQEILLSEMNMAPDLTYVDPVPFVIEWQENRAFGGKMRRYMEQVRAWSRQNNNRKEAIEDHPAAEPNLSNEMNQSLSYEKSAAEEILRLWLREEIEAEKTETRKTDSGKTGPDVRNDVRSESNDESEIERSAKELVRYDRMVAPLVEWFHQNARILRWRSEPKPYYVWVSEIMLQQTRVEAVKAYFDRFIDALPDIEALASCPEEKLLKLWEGLGYYNRVRNLQKAACIVQEQYGGILPDSYENLCSLPGIGSYTAGAIASIAYGKPAPAVDGNVLRVTKRLTGSTDDITRTQVKKEMEQKIQIISERMKERSGHPGDLSQALMELGATVCIPTGRPLCEECPIKHLCVTGKTTGTEQELWRQIPYKPAKKERRIEEKTMFVLYDGENPARIALRKRENKGLLAGLWELPWAEGMLSQTEAEQFLQVKLGVTVQSIRPLQDAKHIFSHVEWHMKGYEVIGSGVAAVPGLHMVTVKELEQNYSLPSAFEAYRPSSLK